jgi:hypothetical protein
MKKNLKNKYIPQHLNAGKHLNAGILTFRILIPYLIFFIALPSCTERIDLQLDESYERLVVDGSITNEATAHMVKLSKTGSFLGGESDVVISGATVTISDGDTTYDLTESSSQPGTYCTNTDVKGVAEKTYTLNIELLSAVAGQQNFAASSNMKAIGTIDSIGIFYNDRWDAWEIQCYARDPLTTDYYIFDIFRNNILLTDTLSEKFVVNDILFNGQYTNGVTVGFLDNAREDQQIRPGDTITLLMSSITEEYANFIWQTQIESGYSNPLFSGPPANIKGNISNGAIGFFAAYSIAESSKIYSPAPQ